ncbi:hypothetical protein R1flu_022839 [Riccia fluitans]|uniref:allene-oxide cyclase n=1 Tax=Riccia fluitans TaxID=41844 RepID=A0ABD1XQC7_9MARC
MTPPDRSVMAAASARAVASGLTLTTVSRQSLLNSSSSQSSTASVAAHPLKSPFYGSSHVSGSLRGSSTAISKVRHRSTAIVSASFLEKLVKLFSDDEKSEEQVMALFEFNELDKGSPVIVRKDETKKVTCLGDFVPYTNKVYDCTGKKYLGISAGLCTVMEHLPSGGDLFETTMSHYVGDYGHISCQGPYKTDSDTEMAVIGGTGVFAGARGWVKCQNIAGPLKLLYTYHITGIAKLPAELTKPPASLEEVLKKKPSNSTVPVEASKA